MYIHTESVAISDQKLMATFPTLMNSAAALLSVASSFPADNFMLSLVL